MNSRRWKTNASRVVHQNPWFKVRHDRVTHPDGRKGNYFVVDRPDCVTIAAVNAKKEICLITMWRYPTDRLSIETPAGSTDGQSALMAAKRELLEETGLVAMKWKKLQRIQDMSGTLSSYGHVFLATVLRQKQGSDLHQAKEGIEKNQMVPIRTALRWIRQGKIDDLLSVETIYAAAITLGILK